MPESAGSLSPLVVLIDGDSFRLMPTCRQFVCIYKLDKLFIICKPLTVFLRVIAVSPSQISAESSPPIGQYELSWLYFNIFNKILIFGVLVSI